MAFNELEELLRDFRLGDYVLLKSDSNKLYRVLDIFDDSPRKKPWSYNYELVLEPVLEDKTTIYITRDKVVKLDEDRQKLAKLMYD